MDKNISILVMMLMMASICNSCVSDSAKADIGHFFMQDSVNFGFIRYENDESICYKKDMALSCFSK
jgi:hypothetical protein